MPAELWPAVPVDQRRADLIGQGHHQVIVGVSGGTILTEQVYLQVKPPEFSAKRGDGARRSARAVAQ